MSHPARNPRAEAESLIGRPARVLEPSPPAVNEPPWFADDPATVTDPAEAVTPTSAGAMTWAELAAANADVATYATDHWLAAWRPLDDVPAGYVEARNDFHRLAYGVISNARKAANGKIGLRYTHHGFGTPFFGGDRQVRVAGADLVVQDGDHAEAEPITTLARAAAFAAAVANADQAEHDTVELGDLDRTLAVDSVSGRFLGDWFGFATSVLEELRLLCPPNADVSRVQIWPGHFDAAVEMGDAAAGQRATYGASPGDAQHEEPYLYVGAWAEVDSEEPYWNAAGFNGASLSYTTLRRTDDQRATALEFFTQGANLLAG